MQDHGQLARPEVSSEVAPHLANRVDDVLAHLLGEPRQLLLGHAVQILGTLHPVEQARVGLRLASGAAHEVRV